MLNKNEIKQLSDILSFTESEMEQIIPYMLKHNPNLKTIEQFEKEWNCNWNRDYSFEDIVDYEEMHAPEDQTRKELTEEIIKHNVKALKDEPTNNWTIYQITNNLWIEINY